MGAAAPVPSFFPDVHIAINDYLAFDFNWAAIWAISCGAYYFALQPAATVRSRPLSPRPGGPGPPCSVSRVLPPRFPLPHCTRTRT